MIRLQIILYFSDAALRNAFIGRLYIKKFHKLFDAKILVAVNSNEFTKLKFVKLKVCGEFGSIPGIKNKTTKTNTDGSILKENAATIKDKIKFAF